MVPRLETRVIATQDASGKNASSVGSSGTSSSSGGGGGSCSSSESEGSGAVDGAGAAAMGRGSCQSQVEQQQQTRFWGVFDGHGGKRASAMVAKDLPLFVASQQAFAADLPSAILGGFRQMESAVQGMHGIGRTEGSTAITLFERGGRLLVANLGDSRAVLCRGGEALPLSKDHHPNLPAEQQRIEESGGRVSAQKPFRVNDGLAMSRSFGDPDMKKAGVIAVPELHER